MKISDVNKIGRLFVIGIQTFSLFILAGCADTMVPAEIIGYNHMHTRMIYNFTVDGAMGSNLNPESGGGKHGCCATIPRQWKPGLKATIAWEFDSKQGDTSPLPPPQSLVVEIPKYTKPGSFHVHFYDDDQVKVVISTCVLGHPLYPMAIKDQFPWEFRFTVAEYFEMKKRGMTDVGC